MLNKQFLICLILIALPNLAMASNISGCDDSFSLATVPININADHKDRHKQHSSHKYGQDIFDVSSISASNSPPPCSYRDRFSLLQKALLKLEFKVHF